MEIMRFNENINNEFNKKRDERIKILGENENNEIEKNFSPTFRFSVESHLQYLEHLRQVVGLRSYGQKDPLSEFRKEAFELFKTIAIQNKK